MKLPCRHIFAVRRSKSLSEFDEALCSDRWKLQYFVSNHRAYQSTDDRDREDLQLSVGDDIEISQHVSEPVLSETQKYRKAFKIAQTLSHQLSTFGMRDFNDGIEVLQSVSHSWDKGKKVFVEEATGNSTNMLAITRISTELGFPNATENIQYKMEQMNKFRAPCLRGFLMMSRQCFLPSNLSPTSNLYTC